MDSDFTRDCVAIGGPTDRTCKPMGIEFTSTKISSTTNDCPIKSIGVDYLSIDAKFDYLDVAYSFRFVKKQEIDGQAKYRILNILKRRFALSFRQCRKAHYGWELWAEPITCGANLCGMLYINPMNTMNQIHVKEANHTRYLKSCLKRPKFVGRSELILQFPESISATETETFIRAGFKNNSTNTSTSIISRILQSDNSEPILERCKDHEFQDIDYGLYFPAKAALKRLENSKVSFHCIVNQWRVSNDNSALERLNDGYLKIDTIMTLMAVDFHQYSVYFLPKVWNGVSTLPNIGGIDPANAIFVQPSSEFNHDLISNWIVNVNERIVNDAPFLADDGTVPSIKSTVIDFIAETYCRIMSSF